MNVSSFDPTPAYSLYTAPQCEIHSAEDIITTSDYSLPPMPFGDDETNVRYDFKRRRFYVGDFEAKVPHTPKAYNR